MTPFTPSLPGYRFMEYLLVLSPHEDLRNRIVKIKEACAAQFHTAIQYGRPHILLAKFVTWSMREEQVLNRLQAIAMSTAPFKVELKNFGSFPTHSLFIQVLTKVPIHNLVKNLKQTQPLLKVHPDHPPHFITDPYILVAHQLKPAQYEKAWQHFAHQHFTGRFIADGMLVLKRPLGEKAFQIHRRLEFMNLPVATVQGELFA